VHGTPLFSEGPDALWLYGKQAFPGRRGCWSTESKDFTSGRDCGERVLVTKDTRSRDGSGRLRWAIGQEVRWKACRGGKCNTGMRVVEKKDDVLRREETGHRSVLTRGGQNRYFMYEYTHVQSNGNDRLCDFCDYPWDGLHRTCDFIISKLAIILSPCV